MKRLPQVIFGICLITMPAIARAAAAEAVTAPDVVYVSDFDLKIAQQSKPDKVPKPVPLADRLGYGRPRIRRTPEQQARDLVELMSRSLLDDLNRAGVPAQRLSPGASVPSSGWIVRGAFLQVNASGQLGRTVVGFGTGSMQMEAVAAVDKLGEAAPRPLYTIDSAAPSGAVVALNPNLALGRFVFTGRDLDRNVKATAEEIADQVKLQIAVSNSNTSDKR